MKHLCGFKIILTFSSLICTTVATNSCYGNWIENNLTETVNNNRIFSHSEYDNTIKNQNLNFFSLFQILYWHDNSPVGEVTNIDSHKVDFNIDTKNVYASNTNKGTVYTRTCINRIEQTSHKDESGNSGSYAYGNNGYDSQTRTPEWDKILMNYLNLFIPEANSNWGRTNASLILDIQNIWKPYAKINNLSSKKVFQNGNQTDYVYSENETINFLRGINRDLNNTNYNVYAIPYTYIKENQYIYVIYNFVSRFVYTLQTNNKANKTSFIPEVDNLITLNNTNVGYFNPSQLLTIDHVDFNNHQLYFGLNEDLIKISKDFNEVRNCAIYIKVLKILDSKEWETYDKLISEGKFDIDTLNEYYQLLQKEKIKPNDFVDTHPSKIAKRMEKYQITDASALYKIINEIKPLLKIKVNYQVYDNVLEKFVDQNIIIDYDDLLNTRKSITITSKEGQYPFRITNVEILENSNDNNCILQSNNEFISDYSTNHIFKKGDYLYIDKPIIEKVIFNTVGEKYIDCFPSSLSYDEIMENFVYAYDDHNVRLNNEVIDKSDVEILTNDLLGTITIKVKTRSSVVEKTYDGFKIFNINDYLNVDSSKYEYGLIANKVDKEQINKILMANDFDQNILNNIDYEITNIDDENGKVEIEINNVKNKIYNAILGTKINIEQFLPIYIKQKNDQNILSKYKPSQITTDIFKKYLVEQSDGFKNIYSKDMHVDLVADDQIHKLVATVKYGQFTDVFNYDFVTKNQILNYICYGLLAVGFIGIIVSLSIYVRSRKLNNLSE